MANYTGPSAIRAVPWPLWFAWAVVALTAVTAGGEFFSEDGPIERASMAALFATAIALAFLIPRPRLSELWHVPVLAAFLAARELDLDKSLLSNGILKLRTYTGDTPIGEKVIGLLIVAVLVYVTLRTMRHGTGPFLRSLRNREGWAILVLLGVVLVVIAKAIDGIDRKLAPLGITISDGMKSAYGSIEEVMELVFTLCLLLAVGFWHRSRQRDA